MMGKWKTATETELGNKIFYSPEWAEKEIERLTQQHESDKALVQATEACARHHQERAESLTAEVSRLDGILRRAYSTLGFTSKKNLTMRILGKGLRNEQDSDLIETAKSRIAHPKTVEVDSDTFEPVEKGQGHG